MKEFPAYKFIADNMMITIDDLQSIVSQIKKSSDIFWTGNHLKENYNGTTFFWLKDRFDTYIKPIESPSVILFSIPKSIFSLDKLNQCLKGIEIVTDNKSDVTISCKENHGNSLILELNLKERVSSVNVFFPNFTQESNNGRRLSIPVKNITRLKKETYDKMTITEFDFLLSTGSLPGKHMLPSSDLVADYFIKLLDNKKS